LNEKIIFHFQTTDFDIPTLLRLACEEVIDFTGDWKNLDKL